jgi:hypothetical protein
LIPFEFHYLSNGINFKEEFINFGVFSNDKSMHSYNIIIDNYGNDSYFLKEVSNLAKEGLKIKALSGIENMIIKPNQENQYIIKLIA